ncbi:MAG: hypothetical protein Q4D07_09070 [Selenomonadaceae bacterium]|nr:hypothetical protein [Selenomonadaceae bacterium]
MSSIKIIDSSRRFGKRRRRRYTRLAGLLCLLVGLGLLLRCLPAGDEPAQGRTAIHAKDDAMSRQSGVFAEWYDEHQEHLLQLDRVWQSYLLIQRQFAAEEIGVEAAYGRLEELTAQMAETERDIRREKPPIELEGEAYDLTAVIYHRTADYAKGLRLMIQETSRAADNYCKAEEDVPQEVMSHRLREISVLLTPTALFTEKEVSRLRNLFMAERGQ